MGWEPALLKEVVSREDLPLDLENDFEVLVGRTSTICQQAIDQDDLFVQHACSPCRCSRRELLQNDFQVWTQIPDGL